jgi:hypothetical protein
MCEDCYYEPPPLTVAEKRKRALRRIPGVLSAERMYYKARGRAKCIAAILRGDAVIFGTTVRNGKITAGALYANLGIGDLTVAESVIERCDLTSTLIKIEFRSQIVSNYLRQADEQNDHGDAVQLVR